MQTEPIAAARSRGDKTAPRGARRRLREPTRAPELLPAPVDKYGRKISDDRVKRLLTTQLLKEGLTHAQVALAVATVDLSPGGQVTIAAMKTIAELAGMGRSTAFRHRSELVARGVLWFDPKKDPDTGAQITSWHTLGAAVFERAGIFFSSPPPSHFGTPPRPRSGHKRDPSSISDPSGSSGSIDPRTNGMEHRAREVSRRPVVRSNEDPAIVDLLQALTEAHADRYRRAFEERGLQYGPHVAGTIARPHLAAMALELRNLAARANEHARTRNRFDLTDDGIRVGMTKKIARTFLAQDRPYLVERNHPPGCLYGRGGADGTPCDFVVLLARAFEEFCAELEDGDPAPLVVPPVDEPAHEPEPDDIAEVRAACDDLRARVAAMPPAPLVPPLALELDDIEPGAGASLPEHVRRAPPRRVESDHERAAREKMRAVVASFTASPAATILPTRERAHQGAPSSPTRDTATGGRSLVAALAAGPPHVAGPPRVRVRACALSDAASKAREARAQQRAHLAQIGEMARQEALAKAREARAQQRRSGRAHLPTRPRARAALLAALTRATETPIEPTTTRNDEQRTPPRLRDVRPDPERRAPLRRPHLPRRTR